jgi:hypothetical protein
MDPFADVPLLDQHGHSLLRRQPATVGEFRACFTESDAPEIIDRHVPWSLFYRRALRDLGEFFGCAPTEEAVLDARTGRPLDGLVDQLFRDAGIAGVLADLGLRVHEYYDAGGLRALLPCPVYPVLRIETLAEGLIPGVPDWPGLESRFVADVEAAASGDLWAIKTIVAYRTGLVIDRWDRAQLDRAFFETSHQFRAGRRRLEAKPLLDTLLRRALEIAARRRLPVQIHAGFGDRDLDLGLVNPVGLRPIIEDPDLRGAPLVLLHCHPYVREAAWLAAVYPHIYVDLSLTIPFLAHGAADEIADALAMAPATKILLATDAFSIPELYWLGARHARRALQTAADLLETRGYLPAADRAPLARRLLHDNAAELYGIARDR